MRINRVYLPALVGKGYRDFWHFKGRYRIVKGGRAGKKSKTCALWFITNLMKYKDANLLVVRQTGNTLKNSCFAELKWAAGQLKAERFWKFCQTPLEMTYLPTGQKIYFRGLDDPLKLASITADTGCLCWLWVEDAFEVTDETVFNALDEAICGGVPEGLFKQITVTFNPWNEHHWLKARFFDTAKDGVLAKTVNYTCNEWLDQSDLALFEDMKRNRPARFEVAGLGNWGKSDGLVFKNWSKADLTNAIPLFNNVCCGLDFGAAAPNGFISANVELEQKVIYVFDEYYQAEIPLDLLAEEVKRRAKGKTVCCDSAGKQNILELKQRGVSAVPAQKGPSSVNRGLWWLQGFDIVVHIGCVHFISEMSGFTWKRNRNEKNLTEGRHHLIDALRYACEPFYGQNTGKV